MHSKKRRYIKTKFIQFIAEKNRPQQDEDEVQDEEDDLLTEIMRDLKKLEKRK